MTKAPAPPTRRLRRLSEEEIELWLSVAERVERRPDSRLPDRVRGLPLVTEAPAPVEPAPVHKAPAKPRPAPLAPLEKRLKQKLSRGRIMADAAIDLHGLRQEEAFDALLRFLQREQRDGALVVIVVTGKGGRPNALGEGAVGVLRRAVPLWLATPAFRPLVVGFEEAGRRHGGSGALYVRLRRFGRGLS